MQREGKVNIVKRVILPCHWHDFILTNMKDEKIESRQKTNRFEGYTFTSQIQLTKHFPGIFKMPSAKSENF